MRLLFVISALFILWACGTEKDPAEELYASAEQHNKARQFDEAVKILQSIRINYESSPYAEKAEDEIARIQSIQDLVMRNQRSKVQSQFGSIHTSLENYRARYLAYPITLKDLEKLPMIAVPDFKDPHGREIIYAPVYSSPSVPRHQPDGYALASFGLDALPGGEGSNTDYFFKNGKDVQYAVSAE